MPRRRFAGNPFAGCQPLGLFLGTVMLVGVTFIALAAVGLYAFTPSDLLQQYNDAVDAWKDNWLGGFQGRGFTACVWEKCTKLTPSSPNEGLPPAREYNEYEAMFYSTLTGLFPTAVPFQCQRDHAVLEISLSDDRNGSFVTQPKPIPIFSYKWTDIRDKQTCDSALGLFWKSTSPDAPTVAYCVHVYVLDSICLTVNQTTGGKWEVSPYLITASAGCRPSHDDLHGCGVEVGPWAYGAYTLVDGSAISSAGLYGVERGNISLGNAALKPSTLPSSEWTANLSSVGVSLRSVYDPYLYSEEATNGTLYLNKANAGSYAFDGNLLGFFGMALFIIGIVLGASTVIAVIVIAIFFPTLRYNYLYKSQHPDTQQKSFYTRMRGSSVAAAPPAYSPFHARDTAYGRVSGRFSSMYSPGTSMQNIALPVAS